MSFFMKPLKYQTRTLDAALPSFDLTKLMSGQLSCLSCGDHLKGRGVQGLGKGSEVGGRARWT